MLYFFIFHTIGPTDFLHPSHTFALHSVDAVTKINVHCETNMKDVGTLCEQIADFSNIRSRGTYT
jgi:hypothetical protein